MAKKAKLKPLCFDMPFAREPAQVTNPELGMDRLAQRPANTYTMDVTVLDTPDHRLLRAGVVLAHRIVDGLGDWYLAAPDWSTLPTEEVEPVGATAELPDRFAAMVHPIRRQGVLGPVAALFCRRREYSLKSGDATIAVIRDDRVKVRRSGLTMARYREVTIGPTPLLTQIQKDALIESLIDASATQVAAFPRLQARLGTPATGLSDFPEPIPLGPNTTLEQFVQHRFASRLRDVMLADIATTSGASTKPLVKALKRLRRDVGGLSFVLEPTWREQLEQELSVITHVGHDQSSLPRGHELMAVIDALVSAARAPRLGDASLKPAAPLFVQRVEAGTMILVDRCMSLKVDSPDERWAAALRAAEQLELVAEVGSPLEPKLAKRFLRRLRCLVELLRPCLQVVETPDVTNLTPQQAFEAGRALERQVGSVERSRREFVDEWPDQVKALRKMVKNR